MRVKVIASCSVCASLDTDRVIFEARAVVNGVSGRHADLQRTKATFYFFDQRITIDSGRLLFHVCRWGRGKMGNPHVKWLEAKHLMAVPFTCRPSRPKAVNLQKRS